MVKTHQALGQTTHPVPSPQKNPPKKSAERRAALEAGGAAFPAPQQSHELGNIHEKDWELTDEWWIYVTFMYRKIMKNPWFHWKNWLMIINVHNLSSESWFEQQKKHGDVAILDGLLMI